ncbi:MAG TPA: MurR/RpiR family transcriptional regulator [Pasteurellaceae bacterium]|nr:MurR/RpiR family transcriptional regulator [Pasteurellaceae bacterium]
MLIELNKEIISRLSGTELRVIKFINDNADRLSQLSIIDIGFETYSSPASVSRAIRKCNISGFNELRYKSTRHSSLNEVVNMGEIINKSLIEVQRTIEQISVSKILDIIHHVRKADRIFVFGRGLTEDVTEEFVLKLQLLDCNAVAIRDPNIMRIKTKKMKDNDVLFLFSLNGNTQELIESAQNASIFNTTIITCTCNENSALIPLSNYSLLGYKDRNVSIKTYEVASRLPLRMIARIIIDYMVLH